ncbi:MAG: EAL domain-containing protein [Clostridiales bacterium]|nr:EAL domain-containing protein [Clostridiales bacterium]
MKKIPLVTVIVAIASLILFGFFLVNYNTYTNTLNEQFESQADAKLSKVNNTTRTNLDIRLSNVIRDIDSITLQLKADNLTYTSDAFKDKLSALSNHSLKIVSIQNYDDLQNYSADTNLLMEYYDSLRTGSIVVTNTTDQIFFLYPYSNENANLGVIVKELSIADFEKLAKLAPSEYNGSCCLINSSGKVLVSNAQFDNKNYFNALKSASFFKINGLDTFQDNLLHKKSGIIHYKLNETDTYAYYSPTVIDNLFLIHIAPSSLLDQDSRTMILIARKFMNSVLLIIFLLVIGVFFFATVYTMKVNKNRDSLLLEQQRYRIALSHSNDTIWEYDIKSDTLTKTDENFGLYTGAKTLHPLLDVIEQSNIIHPDDMDRMLKFISSMTTDEKEIEVEIRARNEKNEYVWFELSGTKLYDSENTPISVIGQTSNINEQKLEIELLKQKAGQDGLTKLYNLTTICSKVNELIASIDTPLILGFLFIDIDNFSELNKQLGHLFGDAVLIDVAGKLKKLFPSTDLISRVGGDEFIVVINDASSITAIEAMAKHANNLFHEIYTGDEVNIQLTCSIGIALYPSDGNSFDTLYDNAVTALGHAKSQGKDQICFYDSSMKALSGNSYGQQKENTNLSLHDERSLVDSSIIANAIDILFDSKEIDISINMMLSLIGNYYNLSCIYIFEYGRGERNLCITHEWYLDPSYKISHLIHELPSDRIEDLCLYKKAENGIVYSDELSDLISLSEEMASYPIVKSIHSIFQFGISDHSHDVGFITFGICNESHKWLKNEIDSLSLLSKIISSYLIRLRSMQKADFIAQKDILTNAYNFNTFLTVANQRLKEHPEQSYAMIYSDIFQFKLINDNYGYQSGDDILKQLCNIFNEVGGKDSVLCRITGDKFTLLLPYETIDDLSEKARNILTLSKQISSIKGDTYKINVMIGIYMITENDTAIVAVDRANIARKNAQKTRKENYKFFNEHMRSALIERKNIEDVMEDALANGEFSVYYQPKVNIDTGTICGAEALIRWNRPGIGVVSPGSFIPLFEDNGFITQIDFFVLDKVGAYLKEKLDQGIKIFPISVNFSREHFKTDTLPDRLQATIEKYNIPPQLIEVEITESAFGNSDRYWTHILQQIRSLGFGLAMDDFGSGLSSLNLLSDLPFKVLKIDKDFFHSKTTHKRERIVISNIVRMAKELDMEVICEGVETYEQLMFLKSIGCYMAQGYYYDKPLPEDEFNLKYLN